MSTGLRAAVALFAILTCSVASADVVVRVQVVEGPARPDDAAAPADAPARAETLLSIETLARPGGAFRSRTEVDGRIVELKGSLKPRDDRSYTVAVTFSDKGQDGGQHEVTTNLLVTIGKSVVLGKLEGGGRERSVLLTVVEDAAEAKGPAPE